MWKIGWGITNECNMMCKFCYSKNARDTSNITNYEEWKRFIDDNYEDIDSINFGTGENTTSESWFNFIRYIRMNYPKIKMALTTNGYLSEAIADNDIKTKIILDSIDEIDISLDYFIENMHNDFRGNKKSYSWALNTLEFCKKNNITTTIVFIGTNDTVKKDNLDGLFKICDEYNAKLRMNIYRPATGKVNSENEFILDYYKLIDTIKYIDDNYNVLSLSDPLLNAIFIGNDTVDDPSGNKSIRILPDGNITPSTYLVSEEFFLGNIKDNILLRNISYSNICKEISDNVVPSDCYGCDKVSICKGGVKDRRILWYKSLNERDPYCPKRFNDIEISALKSKGETDTNSVHDGYLPTLFFTSKSS